MLKCRRVDSCQGTGSWCACGEETSNYGWLARKVEAQNLHRRGYAERDNWSKRAAVDSSP